MKKRFFIVLLILTVLGLQNIFASDHIIKDFISKNEINVYGICDYKLLGLGIFDNNFYLTKATESSYLGVINFGLGVSCKTELSKKWATGPSFSAFCSLTKDDKFYYRFSLGDVTTYKLLQTEIIDLFAETGIGVDYSQVGTCSTLGIDLNLGLGIKANLKDRIALICSSTASILSEFYLRQEKLSIAYQLEIPTKLGIAYNL